MAKLYISTGSQVKKAKFTQDANLVRKASDSVVEVFLNAILSNPMTHVRNTGGNWITQGIVQQERKLASRLFGGKEGGVADYEDIARAFGKSQAYSEMITLIGDSLKKGEMPVIKSNFGGSKLEHRVGALTAQNFKIENKTAANIFDIGGKLVTLNRIPTRFLTVMDNWFKNQEYRSELYAIAYRETMQMWREGWLKQNKMADYLADRIVNPTTTMQEAAYDAAHYVTYQTKLNKQPGNSLATAGSSLQKLKNKTGMMSWLANYYLPFTDTNERNTIWVESEEDKGDFAPMMLEHGECMEWDGSNLMHGNKINDSDQTRVSVDFRVMPRSVYVDSDHLTINTKTPFAIGGYYEVI